MKLAKLSKLVKFLLIFIVISLLSLALEYLIPEQKRVIGDLSVPDLKLPLQGNRSWLLTVEAGGKAFRGRDDRYHKGGGHFALDFDDITKEDGPLTDVPILASGDGKVIKTCSSFFCRLWGSDYYVVIAHNSPYDGSSGYVTTYGHLKESPKVSKGDMVKQGQIIGIMGTTGMSTGTHLHFRIIFNGDSEPSVEELKKLKLDGMLIEDYKVNPKGNSLSTYKYYKSTNVNPAAVLKKRR